MIVEFSALLPLVLAVSLQTAAPATLGAAAQTCPVSLRVEGGAFGSHVHFKNLAAQPISAVIFHAVRVNAVGEEVKPDPNDTLASIVTDRSEQTFTSKKGVPPNMEGSLNDNMAVYGRPMKGSKFVTYVRAVKFADGSVWKDDGSHACKDSY